MGIQSDDPKVVDLPCGAFAQPCIGGFFGGLGLKSKGFLHGLEEVHTWNSWIRGIIPGSSHIPIIPLLQGEGPPNLCERHKLLVSP